MPHRTMADHLSTQTDHVRSTSRYTGPTRFSIDVFTRVPDTGTEDSR